MTLAHESFLFLRQLAEQGAVPFHTLTAEQARAMFSRLRSCDDRRRQNKSAWIQIWFQLKNTKE